MVEGLPPPVAELLRAVEESDEHLALFREKIYQRHPPKLEASTFQPQTHSLWLRFAAFCVVLFASFYGHSHREDRQSTYVCAVVEYATEDLGYELFDTYYYRYGKPLNAAGQWKAWGCGSPRNRLFSKNQAIAHCEANLRGLHDYMAKQLVVSAKKMGGCEVVYSVEESCHSCRPPEPFILFPTLPFCLPAPPLSLDTAFTISWERAI